MVQSNPTAVDIDAAWQEFGERVKRWIVSHGNQPADADDLLQEVFLRLTRSSPKGLSNEGVGAWLFRVARNALIDAHRRKRVRHAESLHAEMPAKEQEDSSRASIARCLAPMLKTVSEPYRKAVQGADLEGRSQKDLAREADLSYTAMKSRVQRGRTMLRDAIAACCTPNEDLECGQCEDEAPCS